MRLESVLAKSALAVFSRVPLKISYAASYPLGILASVLPLRENLVSRKNLELAYPNKTAAEIKRLNRKVMIENIKSMLEAPRIWRLNPGNIEKLTISVTGCPEFAPEKGIILLVPHIGSWEFLGLWLSLRFNTVSLYRGLKIPEVDRIITSGREKFGSTLVVNNKTGVLKMLRHLKKNGMVCLLPDHDPGDNGGVFVDFFNVSARTSTLPAKLARKTSAIVYFACAIRKPKGFELFFYRCPNDIYHHDLKTALKAMNLKIEEIINRNPKQYTWSYKRYKARPDGEMTVY